MESSFWRLYTLRCWFRFRELSALNKPLLPSALLPLTTALSRWWFSPLHFSTHSDWTVSAFPPLKTSPSQPPCHYIYFIPNVESRYFTNLEKEHDKIIQAFSFEENKGAHCAHQTRWTNQYKIASKKVAWESQLGIALLSAGLGWIYCALCF